MAAVLATTDAGRTAGLLVAEDGEGGASEASGWEDREREERRALLRGRRGLGWGSRRTAVSFCHSLISSLFLFVLSHTFWRIASEDFNLTAFFFNGRALFYPDPVCRPAPKVGLDCSTLSPSVEHQGNYTRKEKPNLVLTVLLYMYHDQVWPNTKQKNLY